MHRHRLFVAGACAALLLGAASPAFAKPNNANKPPHPTHPAKPDHPNTPPPPNDNNPPKPPKPPKSTVKLTGGGVFADGAHFSVQAGAGHSKGHLEFESVSGTTKINIRCDGVSVTRDPTVPSKVNLTATNTCVVKDVHPTGAPFGAIGTFTDNGHGAKDQVSLDFATSPTHVTENGTLAGGNITIH